VVGYYRKFTYLAGCDKIDLHHRMVLKDDTPDILDEPKSYQSENAVNCSC